MRYCVVCGTMLPRSTYYAGRPRLYCSNRCRQAAKLRRKHTALTHFVSSEVNQSQ
ncbi:hypothetical protein FBR02_01880 [Anaerolineae bacterium CFX9]|nr:hypothetical protein [Anaerolineae bacterium CFX9]